MTGKITKKAYFNIEAQTITNKMQIELSLKLSQQQILNKISKWISEGSNWTIKKIEKHFINIVVNKPLKGSSYITAPFNNMRTLKFTGQRTNAFFATVNQMFGSSSELPTTVECVIIKSHR